MLGGGSGERTSFRSQSEPEALRARLEHTLGPALNRRGYRLVTHGPAGLGFRRGLSRRIVAAALVLAFVGLGAIDSESWGIALAAWGGAGLLLWWRWPQSVEIAIRPDAGGTAMVVSGREKAVLRLIALDAQRLD